MSNHMRGTRSTFGDQTLSKRSTAPKAIFGSSGRTEKLFQGKEFLTRNLGQESSGHTSHDRSSFGEQVSSLNQSFPQMKILRRYLSDTDMAKVEQPGPGTYQTESSLGRQNRSLLSTNPSWKFGASGRWADHASPFHEHFKTPSALKFEIPGATIGAAGGCKLHGSSKRYDICRGMPGCMPSNVLDPGPGSYPASSSFGTQVLAERQSMPRATVGKARNEDHAKRFLSHHHLRSCIGKDSPAPGLYKLQHSVGKQLSSMKKTLPSMKFGTSNRFSDVRLKEPQNEMPGPGTYIV